MYKRSPHKFSRYTNEYLLELKKKTAASLFHHVHKIFNIIFTTGSFCMCNMKSHLLPIMDIIIRTKRLRKNVPSHPIIMLIIRIDLNIFFGSYKRKNKFQNVTHLFSYSIELNTSSTKKELVFINYINTFL